MAKSMYKGSYTKDEIKADHQIVQDEKQESKLRKQGYLDGHQFFSRPVEIEKEEIS